MERRRKESKENREFRCGVIANALKNLPATIFVNEKTGVYHIRDNTLMIAWGDDLPQGGGNTLFEDLSGFIAVHERDIFLRSFLREDVTSEFGAGRTCPCIFHLKARNDEPERRVSFVVAVGRYSRGRVFEIRIEP